MGQRKAIVVVVLALLMSSALAGCTIETVDDGDGTRTVKDGLDRKVVVREDVRRAISLAPSVTEILFAIGAGGKVVAVDNNTNYPTEAVGLPKVSGYKWLDMETILGLMPDVVIAASINEDSVPRFEERGIAIVILDPQDIDDILEDIRLVGTIMGVGGVARNLASSLETRVDAMTEKTLADGVRRPEVYLELDSFMGYWTYGSGTFGDELIRLSGGKNIADGVTGEFPSLNDEFIIASDPEVIIYQLGPWTTTTPEGIKARAGWGNVTAIREDRLVGVDGDLISRPGPRIVDGLEEIAKAIHPELVT